MKLTTTEIKALTSKARRNTFGNVSDRLIAGLIGKGLVDPKSRRLTEIGIDAVETARRLSA